MRTLRTLIASLLLVFTVGISTALAVAPQFDKGTELVLEDIYSNAETVSTVFDDTGIYGKLDATATADVYKFVSDRDGEQTISLVGHASSKAQPFLVLVDPTANTEARELGVPIPSSDYHTALIASVEGQQTYYEPAIFEQYNLYAQQRIKFEKDKTYYFIVFDPARELSRYVIKFGDGKVWSGGEVFRHLGAWFRVKADNYGGQSPFGFTPSTFGAILFFLALAVLLGMWVVESVFFFLTNRSKMAGYILIKLQKFSRIFTWISLWFIALGGYIYFEAIGWPGIPFVLSLIFMPLVAIFLVNTFVFAPKLMKLEVSKQEATIPVELKKWLYIMFVLAVLTLGSFITLLTMQFS